MIITRFQSKRQRGDMMPRVSLRTLVLMLELLVAVLALQYVAMAQPAKADAVWVAADGLVPISASPATAPAPVRQTRA